MSETRNLKSVRASLSRQRDELIRRFLDVEENLHDLERVREIEHMDQVQVDVAENLLSRLDDEDRRRLEEIEAALARVESGTYGRCEECGARIAAARLEAEPATRWCVACAAAREADRGSRD